MVRRDLILAAGTLLVSAALPVAALGEPLAAAPVPVTLTASDGVTVFGAQWPARNPRAAILLFHQANSNHAEYDPIAPLLVARGYACLAIDQRAGGTMWGVENQTVAKLGGSQPFLSALLDMGGALGWARGHYSGLPVYALGSSYSASLVFLLAQARPKEVAAIAAFSPGEYFTPSNLIRHAAAALTLPIFADSAPTSAELEAVRAVIALSPSLQKYQEVPLAGVHGASTLRPDRDPGGYEQNQHALFRFLDSL